MTFSPPVNLSKTLPKATAAIAVCWQLLPADFALGQDPSISAAESLEIAIQAMEEGQPDRAIQRLETLIAAEGLLESTVLESQALLLEAYVRSGNSEKALELSVTETTPGLSSITFWRAQAFVSTGLYDEAADLIGSLAIQPGDALGPETICLRSILLENQGEFDKAISVLDPLFGMDANLRASSIGHLRNAEIRYRQGLFLEAHEQLEAMSHTTASIDARATYLRGRISLAEGQWEQSEKSFSTVVNYGSNLESRLLQAAHVALADAYLGMDSDQKAEQVLKSFVEKFPDSMLLGAAFQRLESLGVLSRSPMEPSLAVWKMSHQPNLKAIATYSFAVAMAQAGETSEAIDVLETFFTEHGDHSFLIDALLRHTEFVLEIRNWEKAASSLSKVRESAHRPRGARLRLLSRGSHGICRGRHGKRC